MAHEPQDTIDRILDAYSEVVKRLKITEEMLAYTENELTNCQEDAA